LLLVVDMQTRLLAAIHDEVGVREGVGWLIEAARLLGVPMMASEQYPKGLGPTHPGLVALMSDECRNTIVAKTPFSCVAGLCFKGLPTPPTRQVVICGIEAHVCVLQTAFDLRDYGHEVFVVADAVGSRQPHDHAMALERMRSRGVNIVTREMVGFEWLRASGSEEFRQFSQSLLQRRPGPVA
jgi:nicotinamidase-related amidase